MKRWVKRIALALACSALLFILTYQFTEKNSWRSWNMPLSGKVIVIDPGHGGPDGGAIGDGKVLEKEVALNISLMLRDYLQESGAMVIMTREVDRDLANEGTKKLRHRKNEDLRHRKEIINGSDADLFISIHLNSLPSSKWRGAQVFFHPARKQEERLSKMIQSELIRNLENTNRMAKSISGLYLLRTAEIPGALVEVGFLSNPTEREYLKTKSYQQKISASIYQGILRFYTNEKLPGEEN
ncbi:N-acetylmuramoyl-L-alanine amidase CwlD [Fictibacillus aquaticus]|uniref:N-acetylmuramoyl-L-alanine amidase CwlD n=1 Tax=Fictibacillus aquaticus TaxID=2021314 RepID=A0A235F7S8_9BACL|nr:N-acetylmuramoyl-L-alanine amidase CwlD [Fictibacillus aquaticus]OYD57037.1 N-acetylmuramoyl-L-alanine amidase CwlD [Fictibacillus aquaticus]